MVTIRQERKQRSRRGSLVFEMLIALGLVAALAMPLGLAIHRDHQVCRAYYYRTVAMEIVDGELEVLAAGAAKSLSAGVQPYAVRADAARNLPKGEFWVSRTNGWLRLEWRPEAQAVGGSVLREVRWPKAGEAKP
jgi:hypothetical protein